ncbi:hypothetical protein L596_025382 [Steinernema carpocapsae]|uniref:Uncharacterized protein n=1 Tax=Steinernema carpocapsae TaxID=34508 RepID=A0A4U5M7K9_STECR|nr:hypothetical protein L596_025382 [Steinernema carpocapsae]
MMFFAAGLLCDSCYGKCSCLRSELVECPSSHLCFSQLSHFGGFIRKGCVKDCSLIGAKCTTCSTDHCNQHSSAEMDPEDYDDYDDCQTKEILEANDLKEANAVIGFFLSSKIVFSLCTAYLLFV